jgi:hypothetical protein
VQSGSSETVLFTREPALLILKNTSTRILWNTSILWNTILIPVFYRILIPIQYSNRKSIYMEYNIARSVFRPPLALTLESDYPFEILRGIMCSKLLTDKKSARPLPRSLHSELKFCIVRMLLRNPKCRAHTTEPLNAVTATELESPAGSGLRNETTGSALSHKSLKIELNWMKQGCAREEILQEVRIELDGGGTGEVEVRPKEKRKTNSEKERRDDVGHYLLKLDTCYGSGHGDI